MRRNQPLMRHHPNFKPRPLRSFVRRCGIDKTGCLAPLPFTRTVGIEAFTRSGLNQVHQVTVAARAMPARKFLASLSYRMAMRRKSLEAGEHALDENCVADKGRGRGDRRLAPGD